jgi:hypothetical protein
MATRLTRQAKKIIMSNNQLMAAISDSIDIKSTSIPSGLSRNSIGLISYPVLKIISDYTGKPIDELIEKYDENIRVTVITKKSNLRKKKITA